MKISGCCFLFGFVVLVAFAFFGPVSDVEASPGRGRGGGGRKSSGGWFGGGGKTSSGGGWSSGNKNKNVGSNVGTYKKKGGAMKTLKKAAVIGAVGYGAYQLGKMSGSFGNWGWGQSQGYGFNDWNRWREADGFLCRQNTDCNWIDPRLYCQDYELDFQPSAMWFGGDVARIVGECACPDGMRFDDREMQCESAGFSSSVSGTVLLLAILIPLIVACCCCVGGVLLVRKFFF